MTQNQKPGALTLRREISAALDAALRPTVPETPQFDFSALPAAVALSDIAPHAAALHCVKTGAPVATLVAAEQSRLLRLYNVTTLADAINAGYCLASTVSPSWVRTDTETLATLRTIDPHGFFTFCLGRLLENSYRVVTAKNAKLWLSTHYQAAFQNSLVAAWHAISTLPVDALADANDVLEHCLFLNLHRTRVYRIDWSGILADIVQDGDGVICLGSTIPNTVQSASFGVLPHHIATPKGLSILAAALHRATRAIAQRKADWATWETNPCFRRPTYAKTSLETQFNQMLAGLRFSHRLEINPHELRHIAERGQAVIAQERKTMQAGTTAPQAPAAFNPAFFAPRPQSAEKPTLLSILQGAKK